MIALLTVRVDKALGAEAHAWHGPPATEIVPVALASGAIMPSDPCLFNPVT
ncbi:MAG TPA: hypothetical protein VG247_02145 [Pseudonocardiaceae bacterium]|jgi:hypothetical protein|nr:hypothetical protein [Pseudonocardiaceae bacterium]